jgi:hypothetical protein
MVSSFCNGGGVPVETHWTIRRAVPCFVAYVALALGLLTGSENVYDDQRAVIERVFQRRLFSWYGHSEKLVMAAECDTRAGRPFM